MSPAVERVGRKVLDAAFRIHTELGPSLRESLYTRCLEHALGKMGLQVEREVSIDVAFEDLVLHHALRADLVVEGAVIVEVKAREALLPVDQAQVLGYLWHANLPLGYLLNFRATHLRDGIRRYVHTPRLQPDLPSM